MPAINIAIQNTGLVTSIGLTTKATCAALRASITNPTTTRFMGVDGEWIMGHQVPLDEHLVGIDRLVKMATLAIVECLEPLPPQEWQGIPLLLCVAESERPGRLHGLDDQLFEGLQAALKVSFHSKYSSIISVGRPGALLALEQAYRLINDHGLKHVLIAATDSLFVWQTLTTFGDRNRLLAEHNSNGFMPGEAAGAVLIGQSERRSGELLCLGVGHGLEPAPLGSGKPLRAEGLTAAIKQALKESGYEIHDLDFRITDISGEQYFFKEAALAFARVIRNPKEEFDLWHPAEAIGETGSASGAAMIATALAACRKGYAKGKHILLHCSADSDMRIAAVVSWTGEMK